MELDPRFAESWINERHTVLGVTLRPFCLYYRLLFEVTDSPFIKGGPVTFIDLYAAVQMCRMDYNDWLRTRPLSIFARLRLAFLARRYNLESESAKLSAYLTDYFAPPEFWQKAQSTSHGLPPETGAVASQIIHATGWDEERAWMLPLGRAYWYSALFSRLSGADLKFVSESEDELDKIRKEKAEYQAAKAKRKAAELKAEG